MSKNIILLSLDSISNAGDQMLGDTTEFLIGKCGEFNIVRHQLCPNYKQYDIWYVFEEIISKLMIVFSRIFKTDIKHIITNYAYKIRLSRYYRNILKKGDAIIYGVGMLKYSTQDFSYIFSIVNSYATKYNIPTLMNAMSIEVPNLSDSRFRQLVNAVNLPCVKMVTTRDGEGGLLRLRTYYIKRKGIKTDFVGDPALWAAQCYNIKKKTDNNPPHIGIGLIRTNIFSDYKGGVDSCQLYSFYKDLIKKVQNKYADNWALFCNGMTLDYKVGLKLIDDLHLPPSKLIPPPNSAKELTQIVSQFNLIFGARLHSCITSVSLGIPVAGLLWDNKLDFFSQTMNINSFFTDDEDLSADTVLQRMENAFDEGINIKTRDSYKKRYLDNLSQFLNSI